MPIFQNLLSPHKLKQALVEMVGAYIPETVSYAPVE